MSESTTAERTPTVTPPITPEVLKRRQNNESTRIGKFELAATAIASTTGRQQAEQDGHGADAERRHAGNPDLHGLIDLAV